MPLVKFTNALKRFYPQLKAEQIEASTVAEILHQLDSRYPRLSTYLVEENGALRQHVNIFIGNQVIEDKITLGDKVKPDDEVYIMQALSGG